jgi:hypothetical protein
MLEPTRVLLTLVVKLGPPLRVSTAESGFFREIEEMWVMAPAPLGLVGLQVAPETRSVSGGQCLLENIRSPGYAPKVWNGPERKQLKYNEFSLTPVLG